MDIYKKCCLVCGQVRDRGLLQYINHRCDDDTIAIGESKYYTGKFGMSELKRAMADCFSPNIYQNFITYKMFPHLEGKATLIGIGIVFIDEDSFKWKYPLNAPKDHPLNDMLYAMGREFDRKILPRIIKYINAEKDLMYA